MLEDNGIAHDAQQMRLVGIYLTKFMTYKQEYLEVSSSGGYAYGLAGVMLSDTSCCCEKFRLQRFFLPVWGQTETLL